MVRQWRLLGSLLIAAASLTACAGPGAEGLQSGQPSQPEQQRPVKPSEQHPDRPHSLAAPRESPSPSAPGSSKAASPQVRIPPDVKGVYIPPNALQGKKWDRTLRLIEQTELNAAVIDVKNDFGKRADPSVIAAALTRLKEKNIYAIARIVVFKDPYTAKHHPEWAIRRKNGAIWTDNKGISWLDPYNENAWKPIIGIAKQAVTLGFQEVQFDYVRFPEQKLTDVVYRNSRNETKKEIIQRFLRTAADEIHQAGGGVSADVFGLATTARDDLGIGQQWEMLSGVVDVLSPMIYPSHYAPGSYGMRHPDMHPYKIVSEAAKDAQNRNVALRRGNRSAARVRPWLQDFTASWLKPHSVYGKAEIEAQIRALREQGITQYLLWDPGCNYSL